MNVSLTTELDTYVQEKVRSGLYQSASEVIRDGLRLLKERDALRNAQSEQLRKEIETGREQITRGEFHEVALHELPAFAESIITEGRQRRAGKSAP